MPVSMGNLKYEKGDRLRTKVGFIHAFSSEDELRSEFEEGGFKIIHIYKPRETDKSRALWEGSAILQKHIVNLVD